MMPRTCSVDGCDRPHKALGLCRPHYQCQLAHGDPGPAQIGRYGGGTCIGDGCTSAAHSRGMCKRHYDQQRRGAEPPLQKAGLRVVQAAARAHVGKVPWLKGATTPRELAARHSVRGMDDDLIDWTSAEVSWTGGEEHKLEVRHRLYERASDHLLDDLARWRDQQRYQVVVEVSSAYEGVNEVHTGVCVVEGSGLLYVPPGALREAVDRLAVSAHERGEREGREDDDRMQQWLALLASELP
jgi:hypothetical protein